MGSSSSLSSWYITMPSLSCLSDFVWCFNYTCFSFNFMISFPISQSDSCYLPQHPQFFSVYLLFYSFPQSSYFCTIHYHWSYFCYIHSQFKRIHLTSLHFNQPFYILPQTSALPSLVIMPPRCFHKFYFLLLFQGFHMAPFRRHPLIVWLPVSIP